MADPYSGFAVEGPGEGFYKAIEAEDVARGGDAAEADRLFKEAIGLERAKARNLDFVLGRYGDFLLDQDRLDEAQGILEQAMAAGTDIPAIWSSYMALMARRGNIEGLIGAYDRMTAHVVGEPTLAGSVLHFASRPNTPEEFVFAERLARAVRSESINRGDQVGEWAAVGVLGHVLERSDRVDEAVATWSAAFDAGSTDPKTADRLSLNLDRLKRYGEAAAVCQAALTRGLPANTEDTLRKRLDRMARKLTPGAAKKPKQDVPAFSVRSGEGFATASLQRRLSPPLRDVAVVGTTAYCLGYAKEVGTITRVDLETGEETRTPELPALDEIRVSPSGWGLGLRRRGAVGTDTAYLAFLTPDCVVYAEAEIPDSSAGIAYGLNQWFVGCRNGRLYAYDLGGNLRWEWVTPGANDYEGSPYFRPCPYYVAANERFVAVASFGEIYAVGFDGRLLWHLEVPQQGPFTITQPLGAPGGAGDPWQTLKVAPEASPAEVKSAYHALAFATHPDQNPDDPDAAGRFREVQSAYERIVAGERAPSGSQVTFTISMPGNVRGLVAAGDTILAGSSDGVLSTFDVAGHVVGRRVLGKSDVTPALTPDGVLVATYCDGTLSFFEGDAVINAVEVEDLHPAMLVPWQNYVLLVQGGTAHVYDRAGRIVWAVDFPKRIAGVAVTDRFIIVGAGALVVFERGSVGQPST